MCPLAGCLASAGAAGQPQARAMRVPGGCTRPWGLHWRDGGPGWVLGAHAPICLPWPAGRRACLWLACLCPPGALASPACHGRVHSTREQPVQLTSDCSACWDARLTPPCMPRHVLVQQLTPGPHSASTSPLPLLDSPTRCGPFLVQAGARAGAAPASWLPAAACRRPSSPTRQPRPISRNTRW